MPSPLSRWSFVVAVACAGASTPDSDPWTEPPTCKAEPAPCVVPPSLQHPLSDCNTYMQSQGYQPVSQRSVMRVMEGCAIEHSEPGMASDISVCIADAPLFPECTWLVGRSDLPGKDCPTYPEVIAKTAWTHEFSDYLTIMNVTRCTAPDTGLPVISLAWEVPDGSPSRLEYVTGLVYNAYFDSNGDLRGILRKGLRVGTWETICCGEEEIVTSWALWGEVPEMDCTERVYFSPDNALQALDP